MSDDAKSKAAEEAAPETEDAAGEAEGGGDEGSAAAEASAPKAVKKKRHPRTGFQSDGKKIEEARKKVERTTRSELPKALDLLFSAAPKRKFDETVELVLKLGVDPRKQGQSLRGSLSLPKGVGKTNRVIAFCEGGDAEAAKQAGAVEVGMDDLAKRIEGGWDEFDVAVAHPSAMRVVGRLGRVLGPKGKMPSPKAGTVTPNVGEAVGEFAAGKIEYRTDPAGNVHVPVGKRSFSKDDLMENIEALIGHINSVKPAEAKGTYLQRITVTSTMGPGVPVDPKPYQS